MKAIVKVILSLLSILSVVEASKSSAFLALQASERGPKKQAKKSSLNTGVTEETLHSENIDPNINITVSEIGDKKPSFKKETPKKGPKHNQSDARPFPLSSIPEKNEPRSQDARTIKPSSPFTSKSTAFTPKSPPLAPKNLSDIPPVRRSPRLVDPYEVFKHSQVIPGLNRDLFGVIQGDHLIMHPQFSNRTNLRPEIVDTKRDYYVQYTGEKQQTKALNLLQLALLGYISNEADPSQPSCWVPSEIHHAVYYGNLDAAEWYQSLYVRNSWNYAARFPLDELFRPMGVSLKPRLESLDGEGFFDSNLDKKWPDLMPCTHYLQDLEEDK